MCPWKAFRVTFEPFGSIAAHGVFPYTEPEKHDFQIVLLSFGKDVAQCAHVKLAFFRLDEFP